MRLLIAFALLCAAAIACGQVLPGTPVRLMLLRDISSAGSKVGEAVPFVVAEDVSVNGQVVIPEGTMAFAKVCQARREGALSAPLLDRPARLSIKFDHLRDAAGNIVHLFPKAGKSDEDEFQVTREMTKAPSKAEEEKAYQMALANSETKPVMEKIRGLFSDKVASLTQDEAEVLIKHNVPMPFVQQAIEKGMFGQAISFIKDLRAGRTIEGLLGLAPATRPALIAFRAMRELGRISAGSGRYLDGRFKGRNIHCPAGVEITVYVG